MLEISVFIVCAGVAWLLCRQLRSPVKRRVEIESSIVRTNPREIPIDGPLSIFDRWFARVVRLGRVPWTPTGVALVIGGGTTVVAALVLVLTEQAFSAFSAAAFFVLLSLLTLQLAFYRMVAAFEQQLPFALDLLARAVSAGESLDQAIETVSTSVDEPAKSEFKRFHNQLAMGLSVRAAMDSMVGRVDTMNVRIMGSILSVHRENGGNLAETLHRLAEVIRNRFDYHRRLRTVTGAGRVSLLIVITLAVGLLAYLFLGQPDYGKQFFESSSGRTMLTVAVVLEVIGIIWGWMLLKQKY